MAEIKTLPMVRRALTISVSCFFLDFLITEKQLSVLITTKQAICAENGQIIVMTINTSGNA